MKRNKVARPQSDGAQTSEPERRTSEVRRTPTKNEPEQNEAGQNEAGQNKAAPHQSAGKTDKNPASSKTQAQTESPEVLRS